MTIYNYKHNEENTFLNNPAIKEVNYVSNSARHITGTNTSGSLCLRAASFFPAEQQAEKTASVLRL